MSTVHRIDTETDADPDRDEAGQSYPCVQGLIAANVALMTAYANPDPQASAGLDTQRSLLARKVVSNLFFLREHPLLSPGLRQVMANAHRLWAQLAAAEGNHGSNGGTDNPSWASSTSPTAH